jgi:hypothetical protein
VEPAVRVELTTGGLRNRCSTTELRWHADDIILELMRMNNFLCRFWLRY